MTFIWKCYIDIILVPIKKLFGKFNKSASLKALLVLNFHQLKQINNFYINFPYNILLTLNISSGNACGCAPL